MFEEPEDKVSPETEAALEALLSSSEGEETVERGGQRTNISRYFRGEETAKNRMETQGGKIKSSTEGKVESEILAEHEAVLNLVALKNLQHAFKEQTDYLNLRLQEIKRLMEISSLNANERERLISERQAVTQKLETSIVRLSRVERTIEEIEAIRLLDPIAGEWDFKLIKKINHLSNKIKIRLYRKAIAEDEKDIRIIEDQLGSLKAEQAHLWSEWREND